MTEQLIDGDVKVTNMPDAIHTIPTQEELDAQACLSPALIGCHRKGECSCDVRIVADGYAYRPFGSTETTPWEWMRSYDFNRDYIIFSLFDDRAMVDILHLLRDEADRWKQRARLCLRAMGPKSKRRLTKLVDRQLDSSL